MNIMTDVWSVFGRDQGQIVTRAYRYDADSERIIRRTVDGHDGQTEFAASECQDDVEWNGSEGTAPWRAEDMDWQPIAADPFAD